MKAIFILLTCALGILSPIDAVSARKNALLNASSGRQEVSYDLSTAGVTPSVNLPHFPTAAN